MPSIPSKMLNNLSKTDKEVVMNWWNTLSQKIQEELWILYKTDELENQSFTSLSYYVEFVEKEPIQDVYKYKEDLIEFYVNQEIGLNHKLEEYNNKLYDFKGGVACAWKSKYMVLLEKYIYGIDYFAIYGR